MKILLAPLALGLMLVAGQALSQSQAAATLPNAFEGGAETRSAPVPAPAPAAITRAHAGSEAVLRAIVADAADGDMDLSRFTPSLAAQLRGSGPEMATRIRAFGTLRSVEHAGQENGADLFLATFAQAQTQWIVGVDAQNQVSALLFRRVTEPD